jgi:hypothetical protein
MYFAGMLHLGSELVRVTAISYVPTVQRSVDGTRATTHPSGTTLFLATDQRGVLRPASGMVDIGAFD